MIQPKMSRHSCEFCQDHWNTVVRLFASEEEFQSSEYYGGGDKVVNDPHGVTVAVWPGKNNVNKPQSDWEICAPVHPHCGCHFEEYSFRMHPVPKEDWYSHLDFSDLDDDFQKSTSGKVLKEVEVHRGGQTFIAKRWVNIDYGNEFENKDEFKVNSICRKLFGKNLSENSLARLAGAFGNEKVKIEPLGNDALKIFVTSEKSYESEITVKKMSIKINMVSGLDKDKLGGAGIAVHQTVTMIREGKKLGIKYITGDFVRTEKGHDGYFKYARIGFDGEIDPYLAGRIKKQFPEFNYAEVKRVQKFIKEYGLDKWKEYGVHFTGNFYLKNKEDISKLNKQIKTLLKKKEQDD